MLLALVVIGLGVLAGCGQKPAKPESDCASCTTNCPCPKPCKCNPCDCSKKSQRVSGGEAWGMKDEK